MQFFRKKLTHLNIGWNERPLTESDFHRICKSFKITVTEMPLRVSGFYYRVMGRDFIAIDSRLTGSEKLFVMFHELGHFLFHTPETGATANFHGIGHKTRYESEADAFALAAIIPFAMLRSNLTEQLIDEGFSAKMIAERLVVYERFGI
ncbi:MAG: ImmA/IrrE family metallo-endopeptidase [Pyrinomonadaceae bacterium]